MAGDYPTVLDLVGNTPLVRLQRLSRDVEPTLLAKLEFLNPGGSVKDRIGLRMIEQAEREGKLAPGGTIVEPTSGNTGVGLAIAAALKGYRCVFVMPDKIAEEKRALLRAYGAEVVICPTAVPPESPESYYSVSNRLAEEIPGAFKPDQYSNQANPQAHYETTGPELWEQTGGKIDALVLSIGTGGTVTGTARYLKEQRPDLLVVGADPEGSIFSQPDNVHPYLVEGIGEDFWPTTFDPSLVDEFITVSDRDSFRTARRLAREEGILVGGSGGTAVWAMLQVAQRFGPDATVVTIVPDSGRGYLSKVYDDNWLLEHGFLERAPAATIQAVLSSKQDEEPEVPELVTVGTHQKVGEAIDLMQRYGISQIPVVRNGDEPTSLADVVGSIRESGLLDRVFRDQNALSEDIAAAMEPPLPAVEIGASVDTVFADLSAGNPAVVVASGGRPVGVLTRADLLEYLARQQSSGLMEQRLSLVTLGVTDLARSRAFYEALGWKSGAAPADDVVFFQAGCMIVALWGRDAARGGQRRRGSRRLGRHHARLQLPLARGSGCGDRGGARPPGRRSRARARRRSGAATRASSSTRTATRGRSRTTRTGRSGPTARSRSAELVQHGEESELHPVRRTQAHVPVSPGRHDGAALPLRTRSLQPLGGLDGVLDLEREAHRTGARAADLDLVHEIALVPRQDFERGAAGVKDRPAPALVLPRLDHRHAERVAVEAERFLVVLGGDSDA